MEKSINFNNEKINEKAFYNNKKQFDIQQIDTNKILISEPEPYGKKNAIKYIIGYNDNVIRPLHILHPKMIGYIKYFDDDKKTMSFVVDDAELLIKYTEIWNKFRDLINKKFHKFFIFFPIIFYKNINITTLLLFSLTIFFLYSLYFCFSSTVILLYRSF